MSTRTIALAGCGVVGSALARIIHQRADLIAAHSGVRLQVVSVLVRDPHRSRSCALGDALVTSDPGAFLSAGADLVVEATGDTALARRIAGSALSRGVSFITASKALVAASGPELLRAADATGAMLGIEAAVGGAVPVIRNVAGALQHAGMQRITGVLNGTTNFILNRVSAGVPAADALLEAQRLGFAEADPARDLNGQDTADKVAILAWLAFGVPPASLPVPRRGIGDDTDLLVRTAAAAGLSARLVGTAERTPAGVVAEVAPAAFPTDSPWAQLAAETNLVAVDTLHAGTIHLSGAGAGGEATASSLLADILSPVPLRIPARLQNGGVAACHHWLLGVEPRDALRLQAVARRAGITPRPLASRDVALFGVTATAGTLLELEALLEPAGIRPALLRLAAPRAASRPMTQPCTTPGTAARAAPTSVADVLRP
jgi:homoserine dehydrogenase